MNTALRTIITSHKPAVPSWLKPNLVGYWSGQKRENVYYPLTNLVTNGNFANGTTGWSSSTADISVLDNVLSVVCGETSTTYFHVYQDTTLSYAESTIINFRGQARVTDSGISRLELRLYAIDLSFKVSSVIQNKPTANAWYPYNINLTVSADMADKNLRVWLHAEVPSGTGTGKMAQHKLITMTNLTAIFGAGSEPTAAEMDAILAADGTPYWDGTRNVLFNPNSKYFWYDYSGNGRHMKMSNLAYTAGSNLDANGFDVDGVDDYGSIADSAATRLTTGGTLLAWIKPRSIGETGGRIFDKSISTSAANGYSLYLSEPNRIAATINTGNALISRYNAVPYNAWSFVVITLNSSGRHIYVNGVDVTSAGGTETALPPDVAGPVCIGNRAGATDRTFNGIIDRPMIINRALTQAEIQYLFEATRKYYGV